MSEQKSSMEALAESMSGLADVIVETKEGIRDFGQATQQALGAIHALRSVVAALIKTHPNPAALLQALRETHQQQEAEISALPPSASNSFDDVTTELTSHLLK